MGVIKMLNAKKFKKEILNIVNDDFYFAVNKNHPNGVSKCGSFPCADRMLSKEENGKPRYTKNRINWLLSEYELLKFLNDKGFKYIARDSGGMVFIYHEKPSKKDEVWGSIYGHRILDDFEDLFQFVKWADTDPTLIKGVLESCEVAEND